LGGGEWVTWECLAFFPAQKMPFSLIIIAFLGLNTEISESNELIYICTVTPLFDLHLVSNKTYFLSIGIQNTGMLKTP